MIQLRSEVNKSEIMQEVKNQAVKIYKESYQPDLQALAFIQGAEMIFDLLRLPVVGITLNERVIKPEKHTLNDDGRVVKIEKPPFN